MPSSVAIRPRVAFLFAATLAGCAESITPSPPPRLTLVPDTLTLTPGATLPLRALWRTTIGVLPDITGTWRSNDTTIAQVTAQGVVTAVATGTTAVIVRDNDSATTIVRVERPAFQVIAGSTAWRSCALSLDRRAFCWGYNRDGGLGTGAPVSETHVPVGVYGGNFAQLSVGSDQACGLTDEGAAYCWGAGVFGTFGTYDTLEAQVPVAVPGGHRFTTIGAGTLHGCGLEADGVAWCWGNNENGQVGLPPDRIVHPVPVRITAPVALRTLSAGDFHTCALGTDSLAYCWGAGGSGALGNGGTSDLFTPTPVAGGTKFATITTGTEMTCALTAAGAAYCWGWNNYGEVGDSSRVTRNVPAPVRGGLTFTQISTGTFHTCGVVTGGAGYCWGIGLSGQNGDGTLTEYRLTPRLISGGLTWAAIRAGSSSSCGITTAHLVYCWGSGGFGALGADTVALNDVRTTPLLVSGQP